MKNRLQKLFLKSFACCLFVLSSFVMTGPAQAANGTLGLAFTNADSTDAFVQNLHGGQSLWFVVAPGNVQTRQLTITSSGSVSEVVTMSLGFLARNTSGQFLDRTKTPDSNGWVSFSPRQFVLPAHSSANVQMTYSIPAGTPVGSHEAYVLATAAGEPSANKAQYSVPQAIAISRPLFLGIGTDSELAPSINILDLVGTDSQGKHFLGLKIRNTGKVPFSFAGTMDLVDSKFSNRQFANLKFQSEPLAPSIATMVLIDSPAGFTAGKYDVSLQATLGNTEISKVWSNKLIKFSPIIPFFQIITRVLIGLISIIVLVISLRVLRKPKQSESGQRSLQEENLPSKTPASILAELSVEEIEKHLAQLSEKKTSPKSNSRNSKKATAKKATAKKAVAKKAPAKKAPAKKAAVRKPRDS